MYIFSLLPKMGMLLVFCRQGHRFASLLVYAFADSDANLKIGELGKNRGVLVLVAFGYTSSSGCTQLLVSVHTSSGMLWRRPEDLLNLTCCCFCFVKNVKNAEIS